MMKVPMLAVDPLIFQSAPLLSVGASFEVGGRPITDYTPS